MISEVFLCLCGDGRGSFCEYLSGILFLFSLSLFFFFFFVILYTSCVHEFAPKKHLGRVFVQNFFFFAKKIAVSESAKLLKWDHIKWLLVGIDIAR